VTEEDKEAVDSKGEKKAAASKITMVQDEDEYEEEEK